MASSVTHCLFCISEMLSFFICIFLLRHWLQFDLFRDSLWASEAAVFHHGINNNKVMPEKLKSLKSKRFWKRKNRSRSPDRSVSRCVSSECFTSSEDNISSISIDDVSSDITTESENNLADESDLEIDEILEYQGCVLTRFLFGDNFFWPLFYFLAVQLVNQIIHISRGFDVFPTKKGQNGFQVHIWIKIFSSKPKLKDLYLLLNHLIGFDRMVV